jgi:hypothetical protein
MKYYNIPDDVVIDLRELLNNAQQANIENIEELLQVIIRKPGVMFSNGTELLATYDSKDATNLYFSIAAGSGVTVGYRPILINTTQIMPLPLPGASGTYYLALKRTTSSDTLYARYPSTLPAVNIREFDTFVLEASQTPLKTADGLQLASFDWDGSSVSNVLDLRERADGWMLTKLQMDLLLDLLTNGKLFGKSVMLRDAVPATPKNIRITKITGMDTGLITAQNSFKTEKVPIGILGGPVSNKARVSFAWGWEVEGTGSVGTFTVNDMSLNVATDELVGQMVYVDGIDCYIASNTATSGITTTLTVVDGNNQSVDLTGKNGTPTNLAIIHPDADEYIVTAIPVNDVGGRVDEQAAQSLVTIAASPVKQRTTLELPLGVYHIFTVTAVKAGLKSATAEMPAGSFVQNSEVVSYGKPFLVEIPPLSPGEQSAASVKAETAPFGFIINISGWPSATAFEVGWTTRNSGVDFQQPLDNIRITNQRLIEVPTTASREYHVAARPLISGQVVGSPKTDVVVSGAGQQLPNEKSLPAIMVDIRGEIRRFDIDVNTATLSLAAGEPAVNWGINQFAGKRVMDKNKNLFEILDNDQNGNVRIAPISVPVSAIDVSEPLYIGNVGTLVNIGSVQEPFYEPEVQSQRHIYKHPFSTDVVITRITFDCNYTSGTATTPGKIRIYQMGRSNYAQAIEVNNPDYFYELEPNMVIRGSYGNRMLIVDAWDSSGVSNGVSIRGILTIY